MRILTAVALALSSFAAAAQQPREIPWHRVPSVATAVAVAQKKLLLVYYRPSFGKCLTAPDKVMAAAANEPILVNALETFLPLKITEGETPEHPMADELARDFDGPVIAFYDAAGVRLGALEKVSTWARVGEEILRYRAAHKSAVAAAELRLAGNIASADFATGHALMNVLQWRSAAERFAKAGSAYRAAEEHESAQLADVNAGYSMFGAGEQTRGREFVEDVLDRPRSDRVAAEAHLALGAMHEVPPRGKGESRLVGVNARAKALDSYRKAYALAPSGSESLELARRALARLDDQPLPARTAAAASLRIVPPARQFLTGESGFAVEAPAGIARIEFLLDQKQVAVATKAPFRATFDVGSTPVARTVVARAFDARGNARGEATLVINDRVDAFAVSIVAPAVALVRETAEVELDVRVPPGRKLQRVELSWNDRVIATMTEPPFRARLVANGAFGYLRAAGLLDDGTTAEATRIYNAGGVSESIEVGAVTVIASVFDDDAVAIKGLSGSAFAIRDEGVQVVAALRSAEEDPVTIGIAIDSSTSMRGNQVYVLDAAAELLRRALRPQDEAFVVAFDTAARLQHPRSRDAESLRRKVYDLVPMGGTSMFDGVTFALQQFQGIAGKKALFVFSDGMEGSSSASASECERLARTLGVPVFVLSPPRGKTQKHALEKIAKLTGGVLFHGQPADALPALFDRLANEWRAQYVLSYARPAGVVPGAWRSIRVDVPNVRRANVRTIQGYRAH